MAVVTQPCGVFPCVIKNGSQVRASRNGRQTTSIGDVIKTQLCVVAVSLTLFNSVRLPREAFKYGSVPYLVVYSFWLLAVCQPTAMLQLAMGQLSQQDPVGIWRAVPILKGVGHLKVFTSFLCCVYNMMYLALSLAYFIWIGKGTFPLKDCTKLRMTPHGYENKMNATECFNSTFLAPFAVYPQYFGIMGILIFVLWLFVPIMLYRLRKSLKVALDILTPVVIAIAIVLCVFLSDASILTSILDSGTQWMPLRQAYIWHSGLVQALLSTHIVSGYLISAGGTVYRHSDVRWTATLLVATTLVTGWLWVLLWDSVGGQSPKDTSFVAILILIYQSCISEKRDKEWPLFAYGLVLLSGIITMLTLLFPIYDKMHRLTGSNWRLFATILSAIGTAFSVAVVIRGLDVATVMDELVVPTLAVFTTVVEVVGFIFIYGWSYIRVDLEFLTGIKLPWIWFITWWSVPVLIVSITGWWLRSLLKSTWGQMLTLWPLGAVFLGILIVMVVVAAVAVAKEEQFNLITKITAAFGPSRLWGPEEPMARYLWMSKRYENELQSHTNDFSTESHIYPQITPTKYCNNDNLNYIQNNKTDANPKSNNATIVSLQNGNSLENNLMTNSNELILPKRKKDETEHRFRSPNVCIADSKLDSSQECRCNRHFTLHVPHIIMKNNEVTTSL